MTKEIYLNQLKRELRGLPYDDITDILTEIGSHFDEGIASGLSEDEIAKRLGTPKRLGFEYYIDAPKNAQNGPINNKPLATLFRFAGIGLAGMTAFPLVITILAVVFSIYMLIFAGYFTGFMFIISPLLKMISPENIHTSGISPWALSAIGFAVLAGSHFVFKIFNQIVTRIYRYAIKRPMMRTR